MMICPNSIYAELINKSEEEILTKIRGYKNIIGRLKNTIEKQNYLEEFSRIKTKCEISPTYETQIDMYRLYLEEVKKALKEVGGTYKPSVAELRALKFDNNIKNIKKITFSIGGYPGATITYVAVIYKEKLTIIKSNYEEKFKLKSLKYDEEFLTKDLFLDVIKRIKMGEWRRYYSLSRFGYEILDGTQWEIEIEYRNDLKKISFGGSNSYPYNFNSFTKLFGIKD